MVVPISRRFKAGRISIEDDPRQGRPTFQRTDENVQKITDLIKENPRTTLLELEQDTDISKTTIGRTVTEDLRLKKTPAKFIPRFLTNEQKLCRLATCEDMLEMTRTDPEWKDKIITGDETWVYGYDPETKRQSAEWRGQDIAPNDFFLFPKLKAVLKGRHFDSREDIIEKSLLALKSIPKEAYKNCFDNWEKRWRCINGRHNINPLKKNIFNHFMIKKKYQVKVVDQVQNIFLRRYLNLPKYTPGFMLRMECGRVSQEVTIIKQVLRFWVRIMKMKENSNGFSFLKGCPDYTAILTEIPAIIRIATEQSIQSNMAKILNTSHYSHFKYLKNSITAERYLFTTIPLAIKIFFAQLRLLWTIFPENRSKRWKIDLTLTCDLCKNRIQDEIMHIIFGCSCLEKQRKEILGDLPWSQPDCQQICSWMNTLMVDQGLSLGLYKFYKAAVNVRWRIMDSPNVVVCLEEEGEDGTRLIPH
ncbi:hypothetical protein LAZ67_17001350 [Cordylochernes scorpioides]|uniref:Reverse transcriptase zinc-binding domain-containing protein n=1 Tax=Cordylochernes scorpioides TaxID=51811 RepID=A0ABY6LDC0_9ARAC|nr:hypothetical protein LAZ67_17001350 [Cordylochernes scorpioides]